MTGAPVPEGADAVVMVEHTRREQGRVRHRSQRRAGPVHQSARMRSGRRRSRAAPRPAPGLQRSRPRWRPSGASPSRVYRRPEVAIIATGDEIVEVGETPAEFQIRNSNAYSLAAQVARAGGVPNILPVARDTVEHTRERIREGSTPTCCCFRAASPPASTTWWKRCSPEFGAPVLFRSRADPAGPAAGVRQRARQILLRPARQSRLHHGDVRDLRARRGGTARRAGRSRRCTCRSRG